MNADLAWLTGLLAFFWFLIFWVLGGVGFSLLLLLRLGRVRKVRFSCLFTIFALLDAIGAANLGVQYSRDAVATCLAQAANRAQVVTAVFGCGGVGVIGAFVGGILVLILGGSLLILLLRRSRHENGPTVADDGGMNTDGASRGSKYF